MLTLNQCRKLIDPKNEKYSDLQIEAIRGYLTELAKLNIQLYLESKEKKPFKKLNDEEGSHNVQS